MTTPPPRTAADILGPLGAGERITTHAEHAAWEDPVPVGAQRALPTFPATVLPTWVAEQVAAVAEFTQTPTDLAGCIGLAALSTAAGGRVIVNVRGSWSEPVNIFTVVAMPPGSRKSAVFRAMTQPLLNAERQLVERTEPHIIEAELARRVAKAAADKAANIAASKTGPGGDPNALVEATDAAMAVDAITIPVKPRLVADDITPEKAASLLAEQGGRLAVLSAEGGIFATLAGRYSSTPNLDVFLKGHAGDMLRVDRQGRTEHVEHAALTLGLAVQPEVILDIAGMPGFRGKGLLGRLLYALPASNIGRRKINPPPIPTDVAAAYDANLQQLVSTLHDWDDPARLQLSPDADAALLALETRHEPRLHPETGDLGHLGDWAGKYCGAVARLAGLLHLAAHITDGYRIPISADTMHAAIAIGEYFTTHAIAAFDAMGADPDHEAARHVYAWLERNRPEQFTVRHLFSKLPRSKFGKVAELEPALDLLEQYGWIRRQPDPERVGPGRRPSPTYHVHPRLHNPRGEQPPSTTPQAKQPTDRKNP
ncbi:YfjI family protein [Spirillospora sp. NPDC048911]|uniref:YfjI family protein n=1 Tax=Spirillospora sp. NPDC048911 TaxID=3364527 RepID=UPI0037181DC6